MNNDELVTIATFTNSIEASLAEQQLKAARISCLLADEATTNFAWHLSVAVGWIKLKVRRADMNNAIDILTATNIPFQTFDDDTDDEFDKISPADETLERAFRCAVIGLIFFPLQLYSLRLLGVLLFSGWKISRDRYLKAAITIILDLLIIIILWQFIAFVF
ncbi:hypothetical protein [Rivularia sp. UHCC 0363]|uniref:hypothetical protein n=1 Tax=Rivularia sp. UHCC 0363 TaxID=3110244 RepID=UPI002B214453|nr:hypothetical protein [Rivularia sp. UHCC 0363]MEA5596051.1 hypothetical protein [Rivularia sp. UHCC 0363]